VRVAAEVGHVQHPHLVTTKPIRVGGLEQGGVTEGRQPALAAGGADAGDLLIGVIEQRLELVEGERPPGRVAFGLLHMRGGVPLVADLHRMRPEPAFALGRPVVGRVGDVSAEQPHRLGVGTQRRAAQLTYRPQIGAPLVEQLRTPHPRHRVGMPGERLHHPLPAVDRAEAQVPG